MQNSSDAIPAKIAQTLNKLKQPGPGQLPLVKAFFLELLCFVYNTFFVRKTADIEPTGLKEVDEILALAATPTEISDHLVTLFFESLPVKPKLIVELGVEKGKTTFVFERVARLCDAVVLSVDVDDCSNVSNYNKWIFVQRNDIDFADEFPSLCMKNSIKPKIDILFIDTSHLFEHTLEEIKVYFPFLSKKSKVFLHDTNMGSIYFRKNGSMGIGWDNQRGVIRALEVYFQKKFNEKVYFTDFSMPFYIKHYPHCNGLTILEKIASPPPRR